MGCMYQEYPSLLTEANMKLSAATATGNSMAFLVGRLAYTFGLTGKLSFDECSCAFGLPNCSGKQPFHCTVHAGPCISTDTACSSSLVATHLAHSGVVNNESVAAVAGGVNIMLAPLTTVAICQLQVTGT